MRILLTGASGMLGKAIRLASASRGWTVDAWPHEAIWKSDAGSRMARVGGADLIVHAAAWTDVEGCQADPSSCHRANFLLTELLARDAALAKTRMVYVSSTGVYGAGSTTPYTEYDPVAPTTVHHRSKWLGERAVMDANNRNLVIRTGWLFGGDAGDTKDFVQRRLKEARAAMAAHTAMGSNCEQLGVPCRVSDVAERLLQLIANAEEGVFNCVNTGQASRFEYVATIVRFSKLPVEVRAVAASDFSRRAPVSANEMAVNWRMDQTGWPSMRTWQDALADYLQNLSWRDELGARNGV